MFVVKIEGANNEHMTQLVARTCFNSGFLVQAFSLPHAGYVKFDKNPILSRQEDFSDFLILLEKPKNIEDSLKRAKEKSVVIINMQEKPKSLTFKKRKLRVFSLDATGIAIATVKKPATDVVMLGALIKQCDKISSRAAKQVFGDDHELYAALDEGSRNVK